jgi:hypothetical protein
MCMSEVGGEWEYGRVARAAERRGQGRSRLGERARERGRGAGGAGAFDGTKNPPGMCLVVQ